MTLEELITRFTWHKPTPPQIESYDSLRKRARDLARLVDRLCPESREKSLAHTKLEEAIMWANAAIARRTKETS